MSSSIARIKVNGIEVGSLPVETYNEIVSSARQERRLYVAYAFRAVALILRLLIRSTAIVPGVLLFALTFFLIFEPASFTDLLTSLRESSPKEITSALRATVFGTWGVMVIFFPLLLGSLTPSQVAFKNPFEDAVNQRVRSILEVPTEGPLCVFFENKSTAE
jgi:hypothetical protein